MKYAKIVTDTQCTLFCMETQEQFSVQAGDVNFQEARELLKEQKYEEFVRLFNAGKQVQAWASDKVKFENGYPQYNGYVIDNRLTRKILELMKEGFNVQYLVNFMENLLQNPSAVAINELYDFLEAGKLPITEDGCILAYKKVLPNYFDIHTGKSNQYTVGSVHTMDRSKVDPDSNRTCSTGLHICSYEYLECFGSRAVDGYKVVVVKVNPRDIVSIPADYQNTKCRVSRLEVISEVTSLERGTVEQNFLAKAPAVETENVQVLLEEKKPKTGVYYDPTCGRFRDCETKRFVKTPA